jgi:hypothetical protein
VAGESFYDAGALRQLATNLFYGWGYNFYRRENQLRADDQLIRAKASSLLADAMSAVVTAENNYRREFLPPPTRAKPFPDAAVIASAQKLERLARDIGALEASIQHQPMPENDRMTQRYREEGPTLRALIASDERLIGQCELMRTTVTGKDGAALLALLHDLEAGLEAVRSTLQKRADLLLGRI